MLLLEQFVRDLFAVYYTLCVHEVFGVANGKGETRLCQIESNQMFTLHFVAAAAAAAAVDAAAGWFGWFERFGRKPISDRLSSTPELIEFNVGICVVCARQSKRHGKIHLKLPQHVRTVCLLNNRMGFHD